MKIRNFTPHPINIEGQEVIVSEGIIRCREIVEVIGEHAGVQLIKKTFGELEGLPEPEEGTIFVVSIIAATAAKELGRIDCVVPGEVIRDEEGRIVGCKNLAII
jgi:hypothetical protein